jgi:hypothetical protein
MIFEAHVVALSMLPLSQRSSLLICDTRDFDIDARVVSICFGIGIDAFGSQMPEYYFGMILGVNVN